MRLVCHYRCPRCQHAWEYIWKDEELPAFYVPYLTSLKYDCRKCGKRNVNPWETVEDDWEPP